jgi:hypothetical protein
MKCMKKHHHHHHHYVVVRSLNRISIEILHTSCVSIMEIPSWNSRVTTQEHEEPLSCYFMLNYITSWAVMTTQYYVSVYMRLQCAAHLYRRLESSYDIMRKNTIVDFSSWNRSWLRIECLLVSRDCMYTRRAIQGGMMMMKCRSVISVMKDVFPNESRFAATTERKMVRWQGLKKTYPDCSTKPIVLDWADMVVFECLVIFLNVSMLIDAPFPSRS